MERTLDTDLAFSSTSPALDALRPLPSQKVRFLVISSAVSSCSVSDIADPLSGFRDAIGGSSVEDFGIGTGGKLT